MGTSDSYSTSRLNGAIFLVKLGLPVIPLCSPDHTGMSPQHVEKCKAKGKAPILPGWPTHAHSSEDDVQRWFSRNPSINIGVPLGQVSGIIGIDIDGDVGEQLFTEACGDREIPESWEFTTGKGRRLLFSIPDNIKTKKLKQDFGKGQEWSIICEGQQTVLPPSVHENGKIYTWVDNKGPLDVTIKEAPQWILDLILVGEPDIDPVAEDIEEIPETGLWSSQEEPDSIPVPIKKNGGVTPDDYKGKVLEGSRNNQLTKLAGSMLGRGAPKEEVLDFLLHWNAKHCVPPISEPEIVVMVNNIAMSEQMKSAKKSMGGGNKLVFRPTPFVQGFITQQKKMGFSWKFSADTGCFYRCDDTKGPWERMDVTFVNKYAREALLNSNTGGRKEWDSNHCVKEVADALKERLAIQNENKVFDIGSTVSVFNSNPHSDRSSVFNPYNTISLANGVLDWRDLKLHPWSPDFYTTLQLPVEWDANADCSQWKKVLNEWVPEQESIDFLQEFVGLCLIPDTTFRMAVFLYGSGANGKSIFLDGVQMLMGTALVSIPLHRLTDRFETAYMQNILVNICGDIDAKYISDTGVLKSIIAGDTLRGEFKHGKSFDFRPVCRLLFSSNTLPKVSDKSAAWYSRWQFVEFPRVFPINPAYKIDIMTKLVQEKSGILRWAVDGLKRVKEHNKFTVSAAMEQSALEYRRENDNVAAFVDEVLDRAAHRGSETMLSLQALHDMYHDWVETNMAGSVAVGQIEFSKRITALGYEKGRRSIDGSKHMMALIGARLKDEHIPLYKYYYNTAQAATRI